MHADPTEYVADKMRLRARVLLEEALAEWDDLDAIPNVTQALAALYLAAGESPKTVVLDAAGLARDEREERENPLTCDCPIDLVERGGFASSCPVHGSGTGG